MTNKSKEIFTQSQDNILNIESVDIIDEKYLENKFKEGHEFLVIPDNQIKESDLDILKRLPINKYFIQLGYWADPIDIVHFNTPEKLMLTSEQAKSDEEQVSIIKPKMEEYFNKPWEDYIGGSFRDSFDYYFQFLKASDGILIKQQDKIVGMISILKTLKDYLKNEVDQVAWVWVDPKIDKKIKLETHFLINEWLRNNCNRKIQAGIHLYNTRSQKYFTKLGFKLRCANILLKK